MKHTQSEKYFLITLIGLVLVLLVAIFYPFLSLLILACAFSVLLYPVYNLIKKRVTKGKSGWASFLTTLIFLVALCIPIFITSTLVFKQIQHVLVTVNSTNNTNIILQNAEDKIAKYIPSNFNIDIQSKTAQLAEKISGNIAGFFASMAKTFIMFTLMIVSIFYILKNSTDWKKTILAISPLSDENTNEIMLNIKNSVNNVLRGTLFIAVVQGLLTSIGFAIFNVPNPALWGIVAAIASFIPSVGTALVSMPAVVYLYFNGVHINALGLLIWSVLLIGMVDNVLSPYMISKNTEVSSIFTLFSILGGIALLGPIGILIGPLSLGLLYNLVSIYKKQ